MFASEYVDGLWATKSKGVGLIVRSISSLDFVLLIHRRYRWTDGQTDKRTTCNCKTAFCTIVHRVVKWVYH